MLEGVLNEIKNWALTCKEVLRYNFPFQMFVQNVRNLLLFLNFPNPAGKQNVPLICYMLIPIIQILLHFGQPIPLAPPEQVSKSDKTMLSRKSCRSPSSYLNTITIKKITYYLVTKNTQSLIIFSFY